LAAHVEVNVSQRDEEILELLDSLTEGQRLQREGLALQNLRVKLASGSPN
jgi:hypothetical protein